MSDVASPVKQGFIARWWTYQGERFPIVGHGALIAAFSFCAVSLSKMLRGESGLPSWQAMGVAFVSCFLFFLQLRIADEFKDLEDDAKWRPYRPVPRGLVTLRELGVLFVIACLVQLGLAIWLDARLVILLGVTWAYLAAMSKEFFIADWLRRRPIVYMLSHMVIMPLVDLYATASDWLVAGHTWPPAGLPWFLAASFFNGLVIEIGRKIRSPQDEEEGVDTYSRLWGRQSATAAWRGVMAATVVCALLVAIKLQMLYPIMIALCAAYFGGALIVMRFIAQPVKGRGKWIENYSGLWTIVLYLTLGLLPRLMGKG
jgi:4-hydroxybenzoate polyprenyltransferase